MTCREFVGELASKAPAPGGGGAAALVGALGVALGNMVGSLTVGKPKYASVEAQVVELKHEADVLQEELLGYVAADAAAFEPLSRAYGLPSATEAEQAEKARVMEECLHDACVVPLDIMHACCRAIDLIERIAAVGTPLAISDAGCGVACCRAALQAASLNVFVNTGLMRDDAYAAACEGSARELLDMYLPKADAVYARVEAALR